MTVEATYPYEIDLMGLVFKKGRLKSETTEACGMTRIRNERGQATVLTVLFLVVLLGMGALVLDLGSWFREQRDTQSDADAAALAAAQELPGDLPTADALGRQYLVKNGVHDTPNITFSRKFVDNDTVTVSVGGTRLASSPRSSESTP